MFAVSETESPGAYDVPVPSPLVFQQTKSYPSFMKSLP